MFKIASIVNTTSQEAPVIFPALAYESILRLSTGNSDFKLEFVNAPYPIAQRIKDAE